MYAFSASGDSFITFITSCAVLPEPIPVLNVCAKISSLATFNTLFESIAVNLEIVSLFNNCLLVVTKLLNFSNSVK